MIAIADGILDEARWREAKRKVLFVLKEPGAYCGYKSLQELFEKGWQGEAKHSFLNLARWAYGIQNTNERAYPTFAEANERVARNDAFFKSAIVNLKKTPSAIADRSCDEAGLMQYVASNQRAIKEQIKCIGADVIVCCGDTTYLLINESVLPATQETPVLKAPHPSARAWKNADGTVRRKAKDKYDDLMNNYLCSFDWVIS